MGRYSELHDFTAVPTALTFCSVTLITASWLRVVGHCFLFSAQPRTMNARDGQQTDGKG